MFTAILLIGTAAGAHAAPALYSFTGVLSGTLDGDAFNDASVAFRLRTDTNDVFNPFPSRRNIFTTPFTTLAFTIDGVAGTFTDGFQVFANGGRDRFSVVGLTPDEGSDLLDIASTAFAAYDLRFALGPITQGPPDFSIRTRRTARARATLSCSRTKTTA